MIEDQELRSLFRVESAERLQHLDDGLLRLEQAPSDPSLLEELFREAHSLKGAARMLGLPKIQTLAHLLEDALGAARKSNTAMQISAVADMYQTLKTIRALVSEEIDESAVNAGAASAEPAAFPHDLNEPVQAAQNQQRNALFSGAGDSNEVAVSASSAQATLPKAEAFRIESIRVDPKRLDALLTQAGELKVTKIRIARRLAEIDELLDFCDDRDRGCHPVDATEQWLAQLTDKLSHIRGDVYEDSTRLDFVAEQIESGIRTLRLLPLSTLFGLFPRMVHDLAREQHKEVELIIEGEDAVADKHVLEQMKDPLMHMLRNCIDHGIEAPALREQAEKKRTGTLRVKASQTTASIVIEVADDGRGLDLEEIKRIALKRGIHSQEELLGMSVAQLQSLILLPGFSTSALITDVSGRGVGLDVVRNNIEQLKGTLQIESTFGQGLTLRAQLPISLATVRVLIVEASGHRYALPVEHVQYSFKLPMQQMYTMEGRQTILVDGQAVYVAGLDALLGIKGVQNPVQLPQPAAQQTTVVCVMLGVGEERCGLLVDEVVDELEVVLKPQSGLLKRVRNVSGATILETGEVCMVLNPYDLLKTLRKEFVVVVPKTLEEQPVAKKVVLLAEDSITTRTQEKRILEGAGYEVVTAVDGMDAYNKLGSRTFDAVVSDIMMPNMTGLMLTAKIRAHKKYADLPIILVTSLASEDDQRRGLEAGADAYISKPSFDQQALLDCLARLI